MGEIRKKIILQKKSKRFSRINGISVESYRVADTSAYMAFHYGKSENARYLLKNLDLLSVQKIGKYFTVDVLENIQKGY